MTVEFLDPLADPDDDGSWVEPPDDRRRAHLVDWVDVVLSLAGAVLLVVASFGTVFRVHGGSAENFSTYRVTGWGRVEVSGDLFTTRAAKVGILLCVAAGLVVAGLAVRLLVTRATSLRTACAMAAIGVVAATVANAVLDVVAARDNLADSDVQVDPSDGPLPRPPTVDLGSFVWLGTAGAVCVLLALVVGAAVRRRPPEPPPPRPPEVAVDPTETAEDDVLR